MARPPLCSIGMALAPGDRHAPYFREALEHAGVLFEMLPPQFSDRLEALDVLLLCGEHRLTQAMANEVVRWLQGGGRVVCAGSTWGLEEALGVAVEETAHPSNDVLSPIDPSHPWWPEHAEPARFFGGTYAHATATRALIGCGEFVGASARAVGRGAALFLAANVGRTMALMQMGRSVECDGVGPNDGSARLDDGCWRAEDGTALSFDADRSKADSTPHPFFSEPHSDVVKEVWIRTVLDAVAMGDQTAVILWQWPDGAEAAISLAVECDVAEPQLVYGLRRLFEMYGASVCWYVASQGFPLDVYRSMRKWGDDIGLLFSTDESGWQEDKLKVQALAVNRQASVARLNPARPTDGRWKGLTTFYEFAEAAGARISSSKGGRQPGTMGFLFGSCHPFFPIRRDGSSFYIAELPQQVYDPGATTAGPVVDSIVDSVVLRHGCLGATVKATAASAAESLSAVQRLVVQARQRHLVWMPAGKLYEFEKARRSLKWAKSRSADVPSIHLNSDTEIEDLCVLVLGRGFEVQGGSSAPQVVERYGRSFVSVRLSMEPKSRAELRILPQSSASQAA